MLRIDLRFCRFYWPAISAVSHQLMPSNRPSIRLRRLPASLIYGREYCDLPASDWMYSRSPPAGRRRLSRSAAARSWRLACLWIDGTHQLCDLFQPCAVSRVKKRYQSCARIAFSSLLLPVVFTLSLASCAPLPLLWMATGCIDPARHRPSHFSRTDRVLMCNFV